MRPNRGVLFAKDLGGLALYYPGQAILARLPRPLLRQAARFGGDAVRALSTDMEEAKEELELLFGDQPLPRTADEILRDAWRINMFNELEVLRYPHYSPEEMDAVCEVTGLEHLEAALSRGKGAIILIGHLLGVVCGRTSREASSASRLFAPLLFFFLRVLLLLLPLSNV